MIMKFVVDLISNFTFVTVLVSWTLAQFLKIFYHRYKTGKWNFRIFFETGGMPSSHSSSVTALTTGVGLQAGWNTPLFTACFVFAAVVMHDATGVRRAAGKQAEILNRLIEDIYSEGEAKVQKLRRIGGHDPFEVFAGAALAIITTLTMYYVYFIR